MSIPQMKRYSSNETTVKLDGGRALAEMLKLHEVSPMFGMAGFQLAPFYEAIRALGLTHTLINDERCIDHQHVLLDRPEELTRLAVGAATDAQNRHEDGW